MVLRVNLQKHQQDTPRIASRQTIHIVGIIIAGGWAHCAVQCAVQRAVPITYLPRHQSVFSTVGCKLRPTVVGRGLAFLPGASPDRNLWVQYRQMPLREQQKHKYLRFCGWFCKMLTFRGTFSFPRVDLHHTRTSFFTLQQNVNVLRNIFIPASRFSSHKHKFFHDIT